MAVLLHDRSETAGQKQREALRLPRTSAVVALFAFSSRMDRDSMRLFARTHGDEVRAAAIASTGQVGSPTASPPMAYPSASYRLTFSAAFARRCLCSTPC